MATQRDENFAQLRLTIEKACDMYNQFYFTESFIEKARRVVPMWYMEIEKIECSLNEQIDGDKNKYNAICERYLSGLRKIFERVSDNKQQGVRT